MRKKLTLKLALLLCMGAALGGCGRGEEQKPATVVDEQVEKGEEGKAVWEGEPGSEAAAKGRYIERELVLPEPYRTGGEGAFCVRELSDGSLAVLDEGLNLFRSKDGGGSWEQQPGYGRETLAPGDQYVTGAVLGSDGSLGLAACGAPAPGEEGTGLRVADSLVYYYRIVKPDGSMEELDLNQAGLDSYLSSLLGFSPEGKLLGVSPRGVIYEISPEDGGAAKLFEASSSVGHACLSGNLFYVSVADGVNIYDFEKKEVLEANETLDRFVSEQVSGIGSTSGSYPLTLAADGTTLYLAFTDGVYRFDTQAQGAVCEQIVDGTLTTFGNPSAYLRDFTRLQDGSFAAAFYGGALSGFTYDAQAAARPEKEVSIYSLYENDVMRQAAAVYMKQDPQLYVRLETGLTDSDLESGKTVEDAIKNLNTRILAGDGPDLLVLDDLPYRSYEEKGVLKDVSSLLTQAGADLLPNILQAYTKENGEILMMPARFELPLLFGDKESVAGVKDLATLADAVEQLRAGREEDAVITNYVLSESAMLDLLSLPCASAWEQNGALDEAALREFLTQAKRIYDAQISGIPEERMKEWKENNAEYKLGEKNYSNDTSIGCWIPLVQHPDSLSLGTIGDFGYGFSQITSVMEIQEGLDYAGWQGQAGNCFVPRLCIGVNAKAPHPQAAEELFRFLFSEKAQTEEGESGFPVSETALQASMEAVRQEAAKNRQEGEDERGAIGYMGSSSRDGGEEYELVLRPAKDSEFSRVQKLLYSVNIPCMAERNLKTIVLESGAKVLSGELSMEEGLAQIKEQTAIYLSE